MIFKIERCYLRLMDMFCLVLIQYLLRAFSLEMMVHPLSDGTVKARRSQTRVCYRSFPASCDRTPSFTGYHFRASNWGILSTDKNVSQIFHLFLNLQISKIGNCIEKVHFSSSQGLVKWQQRSNKTYRITVWST